MAAPAEIAVPLERIGVRRNAAGTIAVVGNPNAGKSSVFNRLTGLRQHTANYPGVTVERRIGRGTFGGVSLDLIDLPGTYSLSPTSADERIAVDVLFDRMPEKLVIGETTLVPDPNARDVSIGLVNLTERALAGHESAPIPGKPLPHFRAYYTLLGDGAPQPDVFPEGGAIAVELPTPLPDFAQRARGVNPYQCTVAGGIAG